MGQLESKGRRLGELYCVRCGEGKSAPELDRHLWCDGCVAEARANATRTGFLIGGGLAGALALWIWFVQQPSDLVIGGWIATVVGAFWLGSRIGREVAFGAQRFKHRPE